MYKLKNNISPCSLSDFVSIKELNYEMRQISDFERNKPNTTLSHNQLKFAIQKSQFKRYINEGTKYTE